MTLFVPSFRKHRKDFCTVDTFQDGVDAAKKKDAKKLAAFTVLIMRSAGIDDAAWNQQLGETLEAAQE